ncbi:hypothetical protein [Actinomarinicola tropica]|uniref:Uncharacterized protein n=1 Tax=Actinomarinicola tropica TaxID=2789776 RepID=A0A5Q2REE3_9ACTN|nr:hypothetical protein [Actinomarinicola tropica]QGG95288.1 hypothetical protein GH723_09375 [Actinomarinicola tropica]
MEFPTTDVRVHAPEDGGAGTYAFSCPGCRSTVVRTAERPVMDLLIAAGVAFTTWRRPAELVERESEVREEPLTHNDLLTFHEQIADDAVLEAALAAIIDPQSGGSEAAR